MPLRANSKSGASAVATLAEVAARARVSISTVSYTLSGKRPISEATRKRVMRAVVELGYQPHASAAALASQRSNMIALMMPVHNDIHVSVIMGIVVAVTAAAREQGLDIMLLPGNEGTAGVSRVAASGRADAIILMNVEPDDECVRMLREPRLPAVLLGAPTPAAGLTCIDLDFEAAGAVCADHLADLRHHNVALIGAGASVYRRHAGSAARTLRGFERRARERQLRVVHRPSDHGYASAAGALTRILDERPETTAIVVQNETALEPLLRLLAHFGRAVPEDVSIVAICPDELALQSSPKLTCVPIPAQEIGRGAVELVMAQLAGQTTADVLLPPRLIARHSSAAAPHLTLSGNGSRRGAP